MLHGGDLGSAIKAYGGTKEDWLDLSTGINRRSYPFDSKLALADCRDLPSHADLQACLQAARLAYRCPNHIGMAVAPGTQILINSLPHLIRPAHCFLYEPTYSEHRTAMELANIACSSLLIGADIGQLAIPSRSCVVLVNPNNPDGKVWQIAELVALASHLRKSHSFLIVDEAFGDVTQEQSLVPHLKAAPNVVILRSFGKFFGLAGIRLGFALGPNDLMEQLTAFHGPWSVSSMALKIGQQALSDLAWQEQERDLLEHWSKRLQSCLLDYGFSPYGGTSLYQLIEQQDTKHLHEHLAQNHIWSRIFSYQKTWLRLGIPMDEQEFTRLQTALESYKGSKALI
ncbi:MAG: threonine-phosphate decarboxylase CobD [Cohaesibacter sp.]|nr:threonine-phosphate decarboxylase CobD [Cohaesibacter sp.]MCV6602126.1 threonine-phosphate decarboxylase CobD [Cohaesibacter sp.]